MAFFLNHKENVTYLGMSLHPSRCAIPHPWGSKMAWIPSEESPSYDKIGFKIAVLWNTSSYNRSITKE